MIAAAPVLEMRRVAKSFPAPDGRIEVLRDVDLTVLPGEFIAVTGPSGSGKTTLLNLAGLMDHPTSGEVIFAGNDASELDEESLCAIRKNRIGVVFQRFSLLPGRSALENVLFRFRYLDAEPAAALRDSRAALGTVGLDAIAGRKARLLSAGEMQRVAIARAVARRPDLLIADEPTGNLDHASGEAVMTCFQRLNEQGITILMATHNEALLKYASRHLVCRGGGLE